MNSAHNHEGSRSSLVIERHYMPRCAPRQSRPTTLDGPTYTADFARHPVNSREQPSPGLSSVNSHSPNGYAADYSFSEVSSMAGSVSSMPMRQPLDPTQLPYSASDSGMFSGRPRGDVASMTSYNETDVDSVTGDNRYRGELFQPKAAPRIIQKQVRQMYGEVHPRNLPSEELPTPSSGDELETMSEASAPSFTDVPRIRPRASLRRKQLAKPNSGFVSDDDTALSTSSHLEQSESLPRGILKNQSLSTDISDAESLATSGNFRRTASGRTVRFQHNDKSKTIAKKVIDYEKIDSEDSGSKKRRKSSSSDPFSVMGPAVPKPARNDPKRSSGRSSQRGSQRGRQKRSSSQDRSRQSSADRSRSGSRRSSSVDSSKRRASSAERTKSTPSVSVKGEDVKIEMPPSTKQPKQNSVLQDLKRSKSESSSSGKDTEKMVKWCLIIGVPIVLLIVVITVVVIVFS